MAVNLFKSLFGDDTVQDDYYDHHSVEQSKQNTNVVPIDQAKQLRANRTSKISLYEPRLYADVKQITNQLLKGRAVIVNFNQMDDRNAKRVVDFLNGATYAVNGDIKRIGKEIFLCTPQNYEVSGNLGTDMQLDSKLTN